MVEAALKSHQSELVAHGCCAEKSTREAGQAATFPWCDFSSLQRFALNLPVATKSPVPIFFFPSALFAQQHLDACSSLFGQ